MNKRRYSVTVVCFAALVVLVVILLMANSLRRSSRIALPDTTAPSGAASSAATEAEGVVKIEVTPQTVQAAIETLSRPESYVRTMTVETLWSGGSGSESATVTVSGGDSRTDIRQTDGRTRHTITDGENTYIWYDADTDYYAGNAGTITADDEQRIPTYEDILDLSAGQIALADYRILSNENCIYVETVEDEAGYVLRYWVSVESGLLAAAERLQEGQTVYRMTAQPVSTTSVASVSFTLPDGTALVDLG